MKFLKILIVDDEFKILEVLKAYLEKEGYEVITALNGIEALEKYKNEYPDLILLDLMLPDICGEDICKRIREESNVPIIMITAKVEDGNVINGLDMGADDYISKPFNVKQVVARVKALLRRTYIAKANNDNILVFDNGKLKIDEEKREVIVRGKEIILTTTEFCILQVLAKNPKRLFTRDELIAKTLGDENDSYDRVIDSHIKNLRQKIEENTKKPEFIITVYGMGYKFEGKNT
ncbi:MAG: response regulator transcription factor [Clostridium sp.]